MEAVHNLYDFIINALGSIGVFAPILACFLIIIESMIPILPLFVFITINFMTFGHIVGFIISWLCTLLGCMISYYLSYKISKKKIEKLKRKQPKIDLLLNKMKHLSITQIAVVLAIPFTPAFAINIAAGIVRIPAKKYLLSLVVGKIFLVYFWGYIGTSLLESIQNPIIIIKVLIMMSLAFLLSKIVSYIFKIEV